MNIYLVNFKYLQGWCFRSLSWQHSRSKCCDFIFFFIFSWNFPCSLQLLPLVLSVCNSWKWQRVESWLSTFWFFVGLFLPSWSYDFVGVYFCIPFLPWTSKYFCETKSTLHPVKCIWLFLLCRNAVVSP